MNIADRQTDRHTHTHMYPVILQHEVKEVDTERKMNLCYKRVSLASCGNVRLQLNLFAGWGSTEPMWLAWSTLKYRSSTTDS